MIRKRIARLTRTQKPTFIWSTAYFRLKPHPYIALHRQLFILSVKHPWYLLINVIGFLRWVSCYAWIRSLQVCRFKSKEELNEFKVGRVSLFLRLLKLALFHLIPPSYYFKHKLYLKKNKPLEFFYNQELSYFHQHCNQDFENYKAALQLLANKYNFSQALHQLKIPTVLGELYSTTTLKKDCSLLFQEKPLFCKPNQSCQSQDAFLLDYNSKSQTYELKTILGKHLSTMSEIRHFLKEVFNRNQHMLLQEVLSDHPEIKTLSTQKAASTLRIITEKSPHSADISPNILFLQFEIPQEIKLFKGIPRQLYTVLPLDIHSLDIDPIFQKKTPAIAIGNFIITEALKELIREAIHYCTVAHQELIDLRTVAFDLIITKQGPVILEANCNWSIEMFYLVIDPEQEIAQSKHPAVQWINTVIAERTSFLKENNFRSNPL